MNEESDSCKVERIQKYLKCGGPNGLLNLRGELKSNVEPKKEDNNVNSQVENI